MSTDPFRSQFETLVLQRERDVGWLRLNRPQARNAINVAMLEELLYVVRRLPDVDLGALVVCGAGSTFCAGLDLRGADEMFAWLGSRRPGGSDPVADGVLAAQDVACGLAELPYPTVAAVTGAAIGGGMELAMSCDFMLLAEDAVLTLPEVALGLVPDWGGTQRLPRLVGLARAKAVVLLGEPVTSASALASGLAYAVVSESELGGEAQKLAERLAGLPRASARGAKLLLERALDTHIAEGFALEAQTQSSCINVRSAAAVA